MQVWLTWPLVARVTKVTNNYCLYMYAYTQSIFVVYFAFFLLLVFYLLKAPASDVTPSQGISFGDILGQCFCKFS